MVEGEIYDDETTPEEIIKSYDWRFKGFHDHREDKCFLESYQNDHRGRIVNMVKKPKISKSNKDDSELFVF